MTTRAKNANLSPKGIPAPAKTAPKAPSKPAKAPAKVAPPSATKAHQTTPTRKPSATAAQVGQAAGTGLKDATKVTAASVSAKLDAAKPSGPLGLTPGDIRAAQTDPRNQRDAIPPRAPRAAGLRIPSEADAPTQEEMRAALAREAHTPLIAVKRMSAADRRYAKSRIEGMIHAKNVALKRERDDLNRWGMIRELFTKALASKRFSVDMNKLARASTETTVLDVVKLDDYPQGLGKHIQGLYDALDARQAAMKLEGARLLDEIMLGSPGDAIVQIQRFESIKF